MDSEKFQNYPQAYFLLQKVWVSFLNCPILIYLKIYWVILIQLLFSILLYCQTDSFLLLRITFFLRIVEEEKYIYVQTCDTILTEKLFLQQM